MAYPRSTKNDGEPPGKQWRIQAESHDGVTVTLGRYDTKAGAETDCTRIADEGFYRKVTVVAPPEDAPKQDPEEKPEEKPQPKPEEKPQPKSQSKTKKKARS